MSDNPLKSLDDEQIEGAAGATSSIHTNWKAAIRVFGNHSRSSTTKEK